MRNRKGKKARGSSFYVLADFFVDVNVHNFRNPNTVLPASTEARDNPNVTTKRTKTLVVVIVYNLFSKI